MKYINLRISPNTDYVEVTRACSHGDCDQKLKGDENYCPKCGSPLKKLPDYLDKRSIIALVTENIDKLPKPPTVVEANTPAGGDINSTTGIAEADGTVWTVRGSVGTDKTGPVCPYGKCDPSTCGHCTGKGACDVTVLTSMPPQYNMCPFRGSGYIDCKDAD